MQFAAGQLFGRLARRCPRFVTQHAYSSESAMVSDAALYALDRFRKMLVSNVPWAIPASMSGSWFIFTDASHEPMATPSLAGIGAVFVDSYGCKRRFFSEELTSDLLIIIISTGRKAVIFDCEFFAVLCDGRIYFFVVRLWYRLIMMR